MHVKSVYDFNFKVWYFVTTIVLTYCEKKKILVIKKIKLKFEAECREFANNLRSLEQFVGIVKRSEQFLVPEYFFNMFLEVSQILDILLEQLELEKNIRICWKS